MILGDIIKRNAQLLGDRPGLIFEGRRCTHRQFAQRVYRKACVVLRDSARRLDRARAAGG